MKYVRGASLSRLLPSFPTGLQVGVVGTAPARSGEERPTNLDLALSSVEIVVAGCADECASCTIDDRERPAGGQIGL
jgi:hypothetical protein